MHPLIYEDISYIVSLCMEKGQNENVTVSR